MKRRIKVLMTVCLAMSMILSITGCKKKSSSSSDKKVLKVGMECMNAPYNWTQSDDSNGAVPIYGTDEYVNGYDVMIAKKIAEENGYELEVHKIEWDGLIMALQSGTIDAIIAGMSATEERKVSVDFSDSYYDASHVIIVKSDNKYGDALSIDDLDGASCTSQQGTTLYESLSQIPNADISEALPDIPSVVVAVQSGRVDVATVEKPMAMSVIASNPEIKMIDFEDGSGFKVDSGITSIAVAVKKDNSTLLDACNKTINSLSDDEKDQLMEEAISIQPVGE